MIQPLIAVFLVVSAFSGTVFAQTVNLTLEGNHFNESNNLEVAVEVPEASDPKDLERYKIRPVFESESPQVLFIYAADKIFSLGSFWTDLPELPERLTLHVPTVFVVADLWFEIQDTQTGSLYKTAKQKVFGWRFAADYISNLNKNLFGW